MTAINAAESLDALQGQLTLCREQLVCDQEENAQLLERLQRSMDFLATGNTGAMRQFHQRQIPIIKQSIQQVEQRQAGLNLRIERLEQQIIDATPDRSLRGLALSLLAFIRGQLAAYPWFGPSLAISLVMAIIAFNHVNPNADAADPETPDPLQTEQAIDEPTVDDAQLAHAVPAADNLTDSLTEPVPAAEPVYLQRTNTGTNIRPAVQSLCDQLAPLNDTERLQMLRARITELPHNLRGQEITILLGDASAYRRADLLDVIIQNAGDDSIDPTTAPQILGDAPDDTRARMLRQLVAHMPDIITTGESMLILDGSVGDNRLGLIRELAPSIERPIDIWGLEQLADSFNREQREQMIEILKNSSPNARKSRQTIGQMLGR